jgi:hypothetical protein
MTGSAPTDERLRDIRETNLKPQVTSITFAIGCGDL